QTARRLGEKPYFSPHLLLGSILVLLTPTGFLAGIAALFNNHKRRQDNLSSSQFISRRWLFMSIFLVVPLAAFFIFSLSHEPKLNWTGPSWLVVIPAMAALMAPLSRELIKAPFFSFIRKLCDSRPASFRREQFNVSALVPRFSAGRQNDDSCRK
ncbi:MAG: hypothetical protein NTV06_07340, partial [candidate division Zixibacteria bacterium]|nr:hypothetical protein [candidate division Zixibacteria bacterium]